MSSQLRNLLRLVLTEEFIDDGLKENSKQRKRKAEKKDMRARIVPLIVRRKFRPRVKTCYPNFFLHKIIIEPSYMINELTRDISNFFSVAYPFTRSILQNLEPRTSITQERNIIS